MKKEVKVNIGFGFVEALAVAFIVLKLCGVISWPWIAVLAPIWIQLILLVIGFIAIYRLSGYLYGDDWI